MTEVKVCGIARAVDAELAARYGVWAIGINLWPGSRRFVNQQTARDIAAAVEPAVRVVGVFVDAGRDEIARLVDAVPLDMIQLHGDEPPQACTGWPVPVIKALRLRDPETWRSAADYPSTYLLADAYVDGERGGTGRAVPDEWIGGGLRDRLILAGGLDPDNVSARIRAIKPFAVDVASGVEVAPGRKDPDRMKRFIENAHNA